MAPNNVPVNYSNAEPKKKEKKIFVMKAFRWRIPYSWHVPY